MSGGIAIAGPYDPSNIYLTGSGSVTTTSGTYSTITSMTTTPAQGNYMVLFTATTRIGSNNSDGDFAIFKAGTIVQESNRRVFFNIATLLGLINVSTGSFGTPMCKVSVDGTQVVDARFRSTNGTTACDDRSMILVRIGA